MMTSSRLNAEYVTSHYDDDDKKSINDSSLSDAIADILDFYDDEAEKIPANNSFKKSLTSGQLKEPDIDVKYPISPNTDITDEVEETSYSDDASENGDGTPPMPDIYLSSESLSLKMPFESNNSARSDGYHYNDDFEDFDDSASTATDYNIPSICSSACPSTHDFSIDDDDDLLAMGHVDYWEDVTCNHVAQPAAEFNSATHVIKDQTATEAINDVDNYTPDDVVSKAIDTPVTEDISVADDNHLGHADYWEGVQPAYNATTHTIKDKATTEAAKDNHTPDVVSYSLDTPVTEDISVADDNQLGHADYWEDVQPAYNAATHAIKDQTATKDNQTPDVVSNSLDTPVTEDISIADEILLGNADYLEDVVVFFNDKSSFVLPTDAGQNAVQGNGDTPTSASETSIGDQIIVYTANEDENKFSVPNNVDCQQKVIVPEDKIFIENFADEPSMKSSLETFVNEEILIDDIDHNELTPTTSSLNIAKYKSTSISETSSISEEIVSEASDNEYLSINVSHSEEVCLKSTSSNRLIEIQPETVIIKTDTITLDDDQLLANEEHSITPTSVLDDDTCPFSSPLSVESYIQDDIDTLITNKTDHVAAAIKQVVSQIFDDEDHLSSSSLKFNSTSDDENLFEDTVSIQDDRSYLQNQIQDLTTECEHLLKDNESFSKEIKALRSKFHQLILEKEKITQDCNDDLFDYSEAVKEKEEIIEELNKDVQWYTDESNAYKEKNDTLQAEIQQLKNTSDKQKITEEKLCEDKTLLNTKAKVLESDIDEKKIIVQRLCEDNNFLKDKAELLQRTLNQQKLKKEKLSEENVSLKDKTEVLQRTLDQHKLKEEKLSEQNVSLKAKTEVLQSMVDKHKTAAERFVTENNTLKQELEKVKSSEDEKKKLNKVSLMMDDLINENNKLKTELDLATKEKKNTENLYKTLDQYRIKEKNLSEENLSLKDNIEVLQSDLDELVWKHKELEEYNLFMEDIFNESDRDAVLCRKDSETIIAKLETENIRLSDQFQRLQSQSRKERKTHDVFGTRKLKAIQDLERKLVDLRYKNKTLKQQLTDESFKNDALQSTFDVLDIQIHNHRMKSEELAEELDRASEENDDLQQELVQVKKLLQNATNNQLFFQPMAVHNKKLMVQNASLQDSHLGLPTNTIGIDHITSENSPPDLYSSTMNALKRTSNNVNIATLKVVESFDGISSNSSVISSTDDRNSSLPTTNHNMTPSHKTYVNRQWQENMTSMFGEQNKQMTLFKQQVMDDIVDIKRQVAESIPTNKTNYVDNNNTEKSEELTILKRKVKTLKHQLLEQNKTNARNVALSVQKDGKIECLTGIVEAITATNQKLMEENNAWKALKYKNMISAGDTKLQNKTETSKKIGDSSNRPTISDESATTTKTIVSKDKRLKALFAHQEQRMHTIMEKSMERSKTQMDNFRKQFNEMICIAKVSKSKVTGNSTNKDDDDLTEAMGDIPYWTTHSTENDTNDITISSKPTRQPSQKGHSNETEHTHTKAFRGFV